MVQQEAAKYNLHLNLDNSKFIIYNSDLTILFSNGDPIPRISSIIYLGGLIEATGKPGPEKRRRIGEAKIVFRNLIRIWRHTDLSRYRKLQIYKIYLESKLLNNLSTLELIDADMNNIDSFFYRYLYFIANISTIWGAM